MTFSKKFHQDNNAINPIIVFLALLVILIATVGILFTWMNVEERAGHIIQIQNVNFDDSQTRIYVQNTGRGNVIIKYVIIDDEQIEITEEMCKVKSQQTTIIEETKTAEITIEKGYQKAIHLKVVCNDGTSNEADFEP